MIVHKDAIKYIYLQRTKLQPLKDPRMEWSQDIERDFVQLAPYLPRINRERVERILDIGCGLGGIDIKIYHHYRQNSHWPEMLLMDGDEVGEERYGYQELIDYYNSRIVLVKLLKINRVEHFRLLEPGAKFKENSLDIVLSLLSWGHHYPIDEYLESVSLALRPGGRLILDLRKGQTDPDDLAGFEWIMKFDTPDGKSHRTILEKCSD